LNNGDKKGYFSTANGTVKNYWPGALGQENMCACGITKTCVDSTNQTTLFKNISR